MENVIGHLVSHDNRFLMRGDSNIKVLV